MFKSGKDGKLAEEKYHECQRTIYFNFQEHLKTSLILVKLHKKER